MISVTQVSWLTVPRKDTCEISMGKRRFWNAHIVVLYHTHHQLYIYMSKAAPKIPTAYHYLVNFAQRDHSIQGPNCWNTSTRINGSYFFIFFPLLSICDNCTWIVLWWFLQNSGYCSNFQMILGQWSDNAWAMPEWWWVNCKQLWIHR